MVSRHRKTRTQLTGPSAGSSRVLLSPRGWAVDPNPLSLSVHMFVLALAFSVSALQPLCKVLEAKAALNVWHAHCLGGLVVRQGLVSEGGALEQPGLVKWSGRF